MSRTVVLAGLGVLALLAVFGFYMSPQTFLGGAPTPKMTQSAQAPTQTNAPSAIRTSSSSLASNDLLTPPVLGDKIQGIADAKVTIVEYASLTCGHCANFHREGYQHLKTNYINTGKVRYILREFPFDQVGMSAAMVLRCAAGDNYFAVAELMFRQQSVWATQKDWREILGNLLRQTGISTERYNACLADKATFDGIIAERKRAEEVFKVDATPTFFINGEKRSGNLRPEDLDTILKPLLDK